MSEADGQESSLDTEARTQPLGFIGRTKEINFYPKWVLTWVWRAGNEM